MTPSGRFHLGAVGNGLAGALSEREGDKQAIGGIHVPVLADETQNTKTDQGLE